MGFMAVINFLSRLRTEAWFRVGCQSAAGVFVILVIVSPPAVWDALSLEPVLLNPAYISICYQFVLLLNRGGAAGLSHLTMAVHMVAGCVAGAGLGVGCVYIVYAANGGYHGTVTKAALMLVLSALWLFILTVLRFRYPLQNYFWLLGSLSFTVATAASYHQQARPLDDMWKFPLYWMMFNAIGAAAAWLSATLVFPITAGTTVRESLAHALRCEGRLVAGTLALATGEVNPATGFLSKATGEAEQHIGIDSGLFPEVVALQEVSGAASSHIQRAVQHLVAARQDIDLYRRQRRFTAGPHRLLCTLVRSVLSTMMMALYPLQTGSMNCALCWQHREKLLQLAGALQHCCSEAAEVVQQQRSTPLGQALDSLRRVEDAYAALFLDARERAATAAAGVELSESHVAFTMLLSLLFTLCTRIRRLFVLLPGVLGKDQPGASTAVAAHVRSSHSWDLVLREQASPLQPEMAALSLMQASILPAPAPATAMAAATPSGLHTPVGSGDSPQQTQKALQAQQAAGSIAWPGPAGSPVAAMPLEPSPASLPRAITASPLATLRPAAANGLDPRQQQPRRRSFQQPSKPLADGKAGQQQQEEKEEEEEQGGLKKGSLTAGSISRKWLRLLGRLRRAWEACSGRTGINLIHISLGVQMVVAATIVMFGVIIPAVNDALGGRVAWALFVVTLILEPSTGAMLFKGLMRLSGTALGGLAGLGGIYFAFLCNGATYENHPAKFVAMVAYLTVFSFMGGALTIRFNLHSYAFIIANLIMAMVALPAYLTAHPMPMLALWRVVNTAIGVAVEAAVAATVFPVTARRLFRSAMASALDELAEVAATALGGYLPKQRPGQQPPPLGLGPGSLPPLDGWEGLRGQQGNQARPPAKAPVRRFDTATRLGGAASPERAKWAEGTGAASALLPPAAPHQSASLHLEAVPARGTGSFTAQRRSTAAAASAGVTAAAWALQLATNSSFHPYMPTGYAMHSESTTPRSPPDQQTPLMSRAGSARASLDFSPRPGPQHGQHAAQQGSSSARRGGSFDWRGDSRGSTMRSVEEDAPLEEESVEGEAGVGPVGGGGKEHAHAAAAHGLEPGGRGGVLPAQQAEHGYPPPLARQIMAQAAAAAAAAGLPPPPPSSSQDQQPRYTLSAHNVRALPSPELSPDKAQQPPHASRDAVVSAGIGGSAAGATGNTGGSHPRLPQQRASVSLAALTRTLSAPEAPLLQRTARLSSDPGLPASQGPQGSSGPALPPQLPASAATAAGQLAQLQLQQLRRALSLPQGPAAGLRPGLPPTPPRTQQRPQPQQQQQQPAYQYLQQQAPVGLPSSPSSILPPYSLPPPIYTTSNTTCGGMVSIYVPLSPLSNLGGNPQGHKVFGRRYLRYHEAGSKVQASVDAMQRLENALKYEVYPWGHPRRFPFEPGYRGQRLVRHMLNVLAAFANNVDAREGLRGLPLLAPLQGQIRAAVGLLQECLHAFAGLVRGRVTVSSAVGLVEQLERQTLHLLSAAGERGPAQLAAEGLGRAGSSAELVEGLAFLGMLYNAGYVARLLCLALVHTFRSEHPREVALARSSLLEVPARGATATLAADSLLLASNGLLGAALRLDSGSHASYEGAAAAAAEAAMGAAAAGGGETEGGEVELAALDVDGDGDGAVAAVAGEGDGVLAAGEVEEQGPSLWRALLTGDAGSTPPNAAMLGGLGWEAV
ncbi:hypothetical protein N2152v2_000772 [Parachlorella kessleri]